MSKNNVNKIYDALKSDKAMSEKTEKTARCSKTRNGGVRCTTSPEIRLRKELQVHDGRTSDLERSKQIFLTKTNEQAQPGKRGFPENMQISQNRQSTVLNPQQRLLPQKQQGFQ